MARRKGPQAKQAYSYIKSKILSFELPPERQYQTMRWRRS